MNRRVTVWIGTGLLLSALSVTTAGADDAKTPDAAPLPQPVQSETPVKPGVPQRSSTFTPTEKIQADSSVPFPVDI